MVGLILIALGAVALYQIRNGFFMYVVGHGTYWPAGGDAELATEFDELGDERTSIGIVPLNTVVDTQLRCATAISGQTLPAGAEAGFRRLSLVLLGAGKNSLSSVIPPDARRIPELRRDITMPDRAYRAPDLDTSQDTKLRDLISDLTEPDHKIYQGIGLAENFGHLDLIKQVNAILNSGEEFHSCVQRG